MEISIGNGGATLIFHQDLYTTILNADAAHAAAWLRSHGHKVACIVTSPPYYGQRDYGVEGQLGLEDDPQEYLDRLVSIFDAMVPILNDTGSLWVNLGDTYWSGRRQSRGGESKQFSRRIGLRPQDKRRPGLWTRGKQLLLIPHRFAIAMQDRGWIVRNDNVWVKNNPTPDQVRDRCAVSHEYVFHFVREQFYYWNKNAVGRQTPKSLMPPYDTWQVAKSQGARGHKAAFSEQLVELPILATCPPGGTVLDPFAGSGTTLNYARKHGRLGIGVDISPEYCQVMKTNCEGPF